MIQLYKLTSKSQPILCQIKYIIIVHELYMYWYIYTIVIIIYNIMSVVHMIIATIELVVSNWWEISREK